MALVQGRGHGGDNGPPDDDRPRQPPGGCRNPKGRKESRNLKLNKKIKANNGKPIKIDFDLRDQGTAKPVGDNQRDFVSLIGNEIQRTVPFHFESWDAVDEKYKGTLWKEINSHFDMARHRKEEKDWEQIKKGVEVLFQDRYRDRKNKLKAKLFPGNTNPESLRDTPQRGMAMDDWHKYIDFVSSEKFKNRSKKNKANREKLPYSSNHGTKSYAASRYEKWVKNHAYPDFIHQFRDTHMKNGKWNSPLAESRYNEMIRIRESQEGQEIRMSDQQIISQVLGESRAFYPGRGRRLSAGSSSSASVASHVPEPPISRSVFARYVAASQLQVQQMYDNFMNNNNTTPPPRPAVLDPSQFLDADEDADEDAPNTDEDVGPSGE